MPCMFLLLLCAFLLLCINHTPKSTHKKKNHIVQSVHHICIHTASICDAAGAACGWVFRYKRWTIFLLVCVINMETRKPPECLNKHTQFCYCYCCSSSFSSLSFTNIFTSFSIHQQESNAHKLENVWKFSFSFLFDGNAHHPTIVAEENPCFHPREEEK